MIKGAAVRIQRAKRRRDDPDEAIDAETKWALKHAKEMVLDCSNSGDDRPLTGCSFSRVTRWKKILATWNCFCCGKLILQTFEGHLDRLAPSGLDSLARVWDLRTASRLPGTHQTGKLSRAPKKTKAEKQWTQISS